MLDMGYSIFGIPGHEISGQLEDGTPVAIEPLEPCGSCMYCTTGDTQVCMQGKSTIFGVGRDGGMAEQILVPVSSLVALPRSLDATTAFLVEPLAVAVHGVRRAAIDGSIRVLVMVRERWVFALLLRRALPGQKSISLADIQLNSLPLASWARR